MGLTSDTGVHSLLAHLYACVELAAKRGLERVFVHCFTDGRDSPPTSGVDFIRQMEAKLGEIGVGKIASVCGRYWAMDRDNRWQRTEKAYRLLVEGAGLRAGSATEAIRNYYEHPSEPTMHGDEFIEPTAICDESGTPLGAVRDGDSIIFFNFRGDRPRQIAKAFTLDEFPFLGRDKTGEEREQGFDRSKKLDVLFVTMTQYESGLPVRVAFPKPPKMRNIAGEYVAGLGLRQFRCAETEKYPHVTFFFNDYREEPFDGEERQIVPSPKVSTYDQKPEMSAYEVTDLMLKRIAGGVDDLIVVNYANPDMVGHTGSLDAAVAACKTVDQCVGRLLEAIDKAGGCAIITADHGNLEQMIDPETGGPHTSHTTYTVPFYVYGAGFSGRKLRDGGRLADVMPTAMAMLGLDPPGEMTGRSLIV
jgi:2,3-bisphosphoglycerate-independent phosphoglycerate mutase